MKLTNKMCIAALSTMAITTATAQQKLQLITLDPGHFHAALVQKSMYAQVDSHVYVYAPPGKDVEMHLERIKGYNNQSVNPTGWKEVVYTGKDYFKKMLTENKGNLVVLSGNNRLKADYILESVKAGFHVFADKPMVINEEGFTRLREAFKYARENKVQIYDIMTERYEITTMLQRAFAMQANVFGVLEKGTPEQPAIVKESVHHFYKYVSGAVLTRPAWFFDVKQQGEGLVDVTTHLVDLVQWSCMPNTPIAFSDINIHSAKRWATVLTPAQFEEVTKEQVMPDYLRDVADNNGNVRIMSNGEINYAVKGIHARVSVTWNYKAPEGAGDTHYSIMRGSLANLVIRQGAEQQYKPVLYIEPHTMPHDYPAVLDNVVMQLSKDFPGISLKKVDKGWEVVVPEALKEGHEAHFARVMEKYLGYLTADSGEGQMPDWELSNMLAKYYTIIQAQKIATTEN